MLCLKCKNMAEPSTEAVQEMLKEVKSEEERKRRAEMLMNMVKDMKRLYSVVLLCKARKAVVVGNQGIPTQSITTCKLFVE